MILEGKVCIVTGSTAGIGKAIAKKFLEEGATVFVNGRSETKVTQTVQEFIELGLPKAIPAPADVSTRDGCDLLISAVQDVTPKVDVLVNNVGVFDAGDFFEYTDEEWQRYFEINVMSAVRLSRYYLKQMLASNQGRVLIVSSETAFRPIPDTIPYSMTKAAQLNLARGLAELTKGTDVTVNSLIVGPTATEGVQGPFLDSLIKQAGGNISKDEVTKSYFRTREPTSLIQRFLKVEELANVAMFLASGLSSDINGCAQKVDGGIIRHI